MYPALAAVALALPNQSPADAFIQQLDAAQRGAAAVQVIVESNVQGVGKRFSYDLYFAPPRTLRIDFRPPMEPPLAQQVAIVQADGNSVTAYDPKTNRIAKWPSAENATLDAGAALGQLDPAMSVWLSNKNGVRTFLERFGKIIWEEPKRIEGRFTLVGSFEGGKLSVEANESDYKIREVKMESEQGSARWIVAPAPLNLYEALAFRAPAHAISVKSLKEPISRMHFASEDARRVVDASKSAYGALKSVVFSSKTFVFTNGGDSRKLANFAWIKGGNFRLSVTSSNPNRSFVSLYNKNTLAANDRLSGKSFKSTVERKQIMPVLEKLGAVFEPMALAILREENFWRRFEQSETLVRLTGETPEISGVTCDVVEVKTDDGWTAKVFIRRTDGLIARLERALDAPVYSETSMYEYYVVNGPIPPSNWILNAESAKN